MRTPATNRQKKVLTFFGVPFHASISKGAAGWEIGTIFSNDKNHEQWRKYLYLTKDFSDESDQPLLFNTKDFEKVIIPKDWSSREEIRVHQEEIVADILASESPFDNPQPDIIFYRRSFCFTGKFDFGPRKACEDLIVEKRGIPSKSVTSNLDFLVIGTQGSTHWKRGDYGSKIEKAILKRRNSGKPAIVSEDHCFSFI